MPTVFYLGATGYIGGSVLADLLKIYPDLEVTALVRNTAHIDAVRGLGVEVVQGTFSDVDLITSHARKADITVNAADADDVALSTAILAGHKARVVEDKRSPAVLLHTSGVAVFLDGGKEGKHDPNSKIWNDGDEADIRAITPQMLHGQVDAPILRASEEGYTESYIICPAAIVGPPTGPVPSASVFFHFMTQLALGFKKAIYVGEGSNIFYTVRLDDTVDLYRRVFARILDRADAKASPYARYYIAVSTPLSWKDIMTVFGGVLARKGKLEDATAHSISLSEASYPASIFLGSSQHARGERAKALGWVPRPVVLEDWAEVGISASLEKLQQ
ncbi:NAD-binding protein [Lactarius pseudohatsudake]|nr:NAD-binding protein [Lactarius pseudohatsudake]